MQEILNGILAAMPEEARKILRLRQDSDRWQETLEAQAAKMNAEHPKDAANNAVPVVFGENEYVCPKCKNKGVLWYVADNEVKAKQCNCREMREIHRLINASGLGFALKEKRFDNFEVTNKHQDNLKKNAQAYLEKLLNGGREWLIVCG